MAGRVHQIQRVGVAVLRRIAQPHRLRLDGDAAFLFQLHIVEHLLAHVARRHRAGGLDQAIGQRAFAVIDMRDDRKIPDQRKRRVGHGYGIGQNGFGVSVLRDRRPFT